MLYPLSYIEWGDCWVLPPTRPGHSRASMLMVNHRVVALYVGRCRP